MPLTFEIAKIYEIDAPGYSSIIELLVGVDNDGEIIGIKVLSQSETPGLGANIVKEEYLKQYIGKKQAEIKLNKDGGEIDAITGATITSRAVANNVHDSIITTEADGVTAATDEWEGSGKE